MLHAFITANREAIIVRAQARSAKRRLATNAPNQDAGLPLLLTQIAEMLRLEEQDQGDASQQLGDSAAQNGAALLAAGFTVSQVVHHYGDVCQAITSFAMERTAPIAVAEFHTLNQCLDTAIAEAVTEHARLIAMRAQQSPPDWLNESVGQTAHELRDVLNGALLAFEALRRGTVAVGGSTGDVLGRSLMSLRTIIDRTLSDVHLSHGGRNATRIPVATLLEEVAATGMLHSEYRRIAFTVELVDPALVIEGDPQLITSAVMNLLHNAFKYTPPRGHVVLRGKRTDEHRVAIEIEDECGGIAENPGDLFEPFGERRGRDRSGMGLGLSIARKAVRAHAGDIVVRNTPGQGCVFVIDLPLAPA